MSQTFTGYLVFQEDGSLRIFGSIFHNAHVLAALKTDEARMAFSVEGVELGFSIVIPAIRVAPVTAKAGKPKAEAQKSKKGGT
ncbi:MAG: hypothetical protein ACRD2L_11665 [Terriglobia bacterium]